MKQEFSGIEKRLEKLKNCLQKLKAVASKPIDEFLKDDYLRDIVERNLEVAAQCCIDIANRIISIEGIEKPQDYYGAIVKLGQKGVFPIDFAKKLAPIAGFRNILVHNYLDIDWNEVYSHLKKLDDFYEFMKYVQKWLKEE